MLGWHVCRAKLARNNFLSYTGCLTRMLRKFPFFGPLWGGGESEKTGVSPKFPCRKAREIHRRASAGAQGEILVDFLHLCYVTYENESALVEKCRFACNGVCSRNSWRFCSRGWESLRNSVGGSCATDSDSRGTSSLRRGGRKGERATQPQIVNEVLVYQLCLPALRRQSL